MGSFNLQLLILSRRFLGMGSACLVLNCGGGHSRPAEHPVVRMAPFDLNCPKQQLSYTKIDAGTWGVAGCGRRTKYVRICRQVGTGVFAEDECRWVSN